MLKTLLVGTYAPMDEVRYADILACLEANLNNPCFERVCILIEEEKLGAAFSDRHRALLQHPKAETFLVGHRTTYAEFFRYANERHPGKACVIANADIRFDETIGLIEERHLRGAFIVLSRWHVLPDGTVQFDAQASCAQDAWCFLTLITVPAEANFSCGCAGCDNKIAHLMRSAGYGVYNPAYSIRLFHHHTPGTGGNYGPSVPGPHLLVAPCELPK